MNKKYFFLTLFLIFCCFLSAGCKTLRQPESVAGELDYTDEDVFNNEKNQILKLMETDCVKALWRASFLKDQSVISECSEKVSSEFNKAIDEKDYFEAKRLFSALQNCGVLKKEDASNLEKLNDSQVPGTVVDKSKLPSNIAQSIDATVTVWVDKGIKIENGAGLADVVIGSGFFIDKRGYLITNHHVIEDCVNPKYEGFCRLYVKLPGDMDSKYPAKVIGYDSVMDFALLKVEFEPSYVFSLGSSSELNVGDKISVIGTPIGLDGTLTSGIISNVNRQLTIIGKVFQIDAAVNSGNSGGPMIDQNRRVQAIVFAGMLQYQGLNFAIPVEYLKQELPLLYKGGEVKHSWTGCYGHTYKNKGVKQGLEVQYVLPGGIAHFAGLRAGDIITGIDDMTVTSLEDYQYALMGNQAGSVVKCSYLRDGKPFETALYLEKRPENASVLFYNSDFISESFIPLYGMKMCPASTSNRKSYKILDVIKGSLADDLGFSENDPVTVYDVKIDSQNQIITTQLYIQRKSKGYLDVSLMIQTAFDSPYYF